MIDWQIHFQREEAEEFSWELFEVGALGVEILSENTLRAFFKGEEEERSQFQREAEALGFSFISAEVIPETNWVQQCAALMEENTIGDLTILPVVGPDHLPEVRAKNTLLLIPGAGFGTGHHVSTEMAIMHLQSDAVRTLKPVRVFDLGTGSGILAVVVAHLFNAQVDAVDIEAPAIINATDNAQINGVSSGITFSIGSMEKASGEYDLIMANLYAEILCDSEPAFQDHLRPGGLLVVSGVLLTLLEKIESRFVAPRWKLIQQKEELGWYSAIFQKI